MKHCVYAFAFTRITQKAMAEFRSAGANYAASHSAAARFSHNSRRKIRTEFMDGSTGAAGQISSAMMTMAPGTYILSFDLIGSERGLTTSTNFMLGSLFNQTFILGSSDGSSGNWGTSGQRQFRVRVRGNS
jgi:hypothetical protein